MGDWLRAAIGWACWAVDRVAIAFKSQFNPCFINYACRRWPRFDTWFWRENSDGPVA